MKAVARIGVVLTLTASIAFLPAAPAMAAVDPKIATAVTYPDWSPNLQPEKTSQLWIDLRNDGDEIATGVSATLSSSDPYIDVVEPGPRTFTDIEVKNEVTPSPNDEPFGVAVGATEECAAHFELAVSTDQGDFTIPFEVPIEPCTPPPPPPAPSIRIQQIKILDSESNDVLTDLTIGRAVELEIELVNEGELDADSVTGQLTIPDGHAHVSDANADFGSIPAGESSTRSFEISLTECDPLGLLIHLKIEGAPVAELNYGTTPPPEGTLDYLLETRCPGLHLIFRGAEYDDVEGGNGDGIPQPGETVAITIAIENDGADVLSGLTATFDSDDADVLQANSSYPDIAPAAVAENTTPFVVRIHEDTESLHFFLDSGCAWHAFGESHPVPSETVVAAFDQQITITTSDGETLVEESKRVVVCSMPSVPTGGILAESGTAPKGLTAAGTTLVVLGWLMRRRAARLA